MQAKEIHDELVVAVPAQALWSALADIGQHAAWHPFATRITGAHALGRQRECTVQMGRTTGHTSETCIVWQEQREVAWRIDADSTGFSAMVADWSAGFRLEPAGPGRTRVVAYSRFVPARIMARLMLPMIRIQFHRVQRQILAALRTHAEAGGDVAPVRAASGT